MWVGAFRCGFAWFIEPSVGVRESETHYENPKAETHAHPPSTRLDQRYHEVQSNHNWSASTTAMASG